MTLLYLDVADTLALTRACKELHAELPAVLKVTTYNINRHLKKFFEDPVGFRTTQGRCGALIGGAFPFQFFQGSNNTTDRLYIVVEDDYLLSHYLLREGYTDVKGIHEKQVGSEKISIRLFENVDQATIAAVLSSTATTASLNFISWNKAYSLFPHSTFIKKECFLLCSYSGEKSLAQRLSDLGQLGIKMKTISWDRRRESIGERNYGGNRRTDTLTRRRRIGDKYTWVVSLDTKAVITPEQPDGVLESTTFRLEVPRIWDRDSTFSYYNIDFDETLCHPILKYRFVTLKEDTLDEGEPVLDEYYQRIRTSYYSQKCDELKDHLDEVTCLELTKVPVKDRTPGFARITEDKFGAARSLRGEFNLPTTWTYYDSDVIDFLAEAWKSKLEFDEKEEAELAKDRMDEVAKIRVR